MDHPARFYQFSMPVFPPPLAEFTLVDDPVTDRSANECQQHVGEMRIGAPDSSCQRSSNEILLQIQICNGFRCGPEKFFAHIAGDDRFADHAPSAAENPVHGGRLFVRAVVCGDGDIFQSRMLLKNPVQKRLGGIGHHVVSRCIAGLHFKPQIKQVANDLMVQIKELPPQNLPAAEFSRGFVYVDIVLTPELEAEGYAREIIRRIQDMRKELDLRVEDQIRAVVDIESKPILDLALQKKEHIAGEVRAADFQLGLGLELQGKLVKDWDIEGVCVRIGIERF